LLATVLVLAGLWTFAVGSGIGSGRLTNGEQKPPIDQSDGSLASLTAAGKIEDLGQVVVGPSSCFKTITQALKYVKENYKPASDRLGRQTILVEGGTPYLERIVIDDSYPPGIHLVAEIDERPILAPQGADPIIKLDGVTRFEIEGFDLKAERLKVAVELTGFLKGSKLKDLHILGFTKAGVLGNGPVGFGAKKRGVYLEDLVFRAAAAEAVGMKFQAGAQETAQIKVRNCRFLGPMSDGIVLTE